MQSDASDDQELTVVSGLIAEDGSDKEIETNSQSTETSAPQVKLTEDILASLATAGLWEEVPEESFDDVIPCHKLRLFVVYRYLKFLAILSIYFLFSMSS
jgi:hypothetical protein